VKLLRRVPYHGPYFSDSAAESEFVMVPGAFIPGYWDRIWNRADAAPLEQRRAIRSQANMLPVALPVLSMHDVLRMEPRS
jgi:hypothetical protein